MALRLLPLLWELVPWLLSLLLSFTRGSSLLQWLPAAVRFLEGTRIKSFVFSGERLLWIPNATPPAHLTGEFPGDRGFDPLGLSKDPKVFARMRISEVFHGRLAMLGIVGCVGQEWLFNKGAWFDYSEQGSL